jgi:hydroxypyruvate isomerase
MNRRDFSTATLLGAVSASAQTPLPARATITSSVMLWTLKGSFEQKMEAAARSGVQSVELVTEHINWTGADVTRAKNLARSFGLGMDALLGQPNWTTRPVTMVNPEHRPGFLKDVNAAIDWARKLEIPQVILMSGNAIPGRSRADQFASMVEGGKRAAELAGKSEVTLIIEPLNSRIDHKGYFLDTCVEGLRLVREVGHPRFRLLFDIYHEQVQTGNVIQTLTEAAPFTSVFHVADNPGRNDPGTGEINYPNVYRAIQKTGFAGYVAMEYVPLGEQVASLINSLNGFRAAIA